MERNGATTVSDRRFIWDGNTLVEQRNGTSTTAAQRYLPQGVQQGTSKFFYTRDHLGSIREVVNNSGSVVARYDYDPYGRRTKLSGTFDSDFGFTGHYLHAPSGLHFAPFRAYSAEFGRWISRDPIEEEGGVNLYGYVASNPVNWVDPLGLEIVYRGSNMDDWHQSRDYLRCDPAMRDIIDKLESSKDKVFIVTNSKHDDQNRDGLLGQNVVRWDPHSALKTTEGGRQSPALGLGHELDHALQRATNPNQPRYPDPQYDNSEERRVITGSEASAARTLGDDRRYDHSGTPYRVPSPTSR